MGVRSHHAFSEIDKLMVRVRGAKRGAPDANPRGYQRVTSLGRCQSWNIIGACFTNLETKGTVCSHRIAIDLSSTR